MDKKDSGEEFVLELEGDQFVKVGSILNHDKGSLLVYLLFQGKLNYTLQNYACNLEGAGDGTLQYWR